MNNVVRGTYTYDAFGNLIAQVGESDNPFLYCGEYFDAETGTYYLRARYYNPTNGRFNAEDAHWNVTNRIYGDNPFEIYEYTGYQGANKYILLPSISAILQSGNLYVYCIDNPISYIDSNGNTTYAASVDASATFLVKFGLSGQIVIDDDCNVGILVCVSAGGGTPAASVSVGITVTNADTIFDLNGLGVAGGGSAVFGLDVTGGTAQDGTPVVGTQVSMPIVTVPFPEGHGEVSYSFVISLNWLSKKTKEKLYNEVYSLYEAYLSSDQE